MSKKLETRNRIMKIALKLFSEQGYYATTTKQIAQAAEISEITLFRHFGTKENLFQETTFNYVKDINIKNEIERLKKQDFTESIIEIARDYLDFCYRNRKLYKIQMRLTDDEKDFVRLKLSREFVKVLEDYFRDLLDENIIDGNPHIMAVTLINSILGAFTVHVLTDNSFTETSLEELVDEHAKQFAKFYRK
ncbi:TetR/AcrR family transcriptional regulator [Vallitalea okinawensis]|uniref:TetR/AcrR family transcriptional regulator n=1 Tax=Vallitalea okinawensis TaxID=2078660 RepID=UPI001300553F|nr:TetR/AcrR family transcriptional regulator [Vallitalea okinawensis]